MQLQKFTDPITGIPFDAVVNSEGMVIEHPLTGEKHVIPIVNGEIRFPLELFNHIEIMRADEVTKYLNITRQRLNQLIQAGKFTMACPQPAFFFTKESVLEYKRTRKPGRPKEK